MEAIDKKPSIFCDPQWFLKKYDGRKKEFKGMTRNTFHAACRKHFLRDCAANWPARDPFRERREIIAYFATIPYEYEGNGLDDYNLYQRPAGNGVGYVAICPGESGNNFYTEDPIVVAYLKQKYEKHRKI